MKTITILLSCLFSSYLLLAQTPVEPAAGNGTEGSPYVIATLENLYWIAAYNDEVAEPDQETRWSSHYIQVADIDASETAEWFNGNGWLPIGNPFSGVYDGQNYTIDSLFINRTDQFAVGLFFWTEEGIIKNLGVTNVDITGYENTGALVGYNYYNSIVTHCHSTGNIQGSHMLGGLVGENMTHSQILHSHSTCNVTGVDWSLGGLVGFNSNESIIDHCYSTGDVSSGIYWSYSGGLVGQNVNLSSINNSYSTGNVFGGFAVGGLVGYNESYITNSFSSANVTATEYVGGLVGWDLYSTISNCYATGTVIAQGSYSYVGNDVGGLIGNMYNSSVSNSFSTGLVIGVDLEYAGGLIGVNETGVDIINSYWDTETSEIEHSDGGEGRTTEEMTYPYTEDTYLDWDFQEIWGEDPNFEINEGYPFLRWQIAEEIPPPPAMAHSPFPEHEAINVPVNTDIGWTYSSQEGFSDPDGYILNLWVGDTTGYHLQGSMEGGPGEYYFSNHPFILEHEMSYYWQVIPYFIHEEEQILAEDCPIWLFTTETATGITEKLPNMDRLIDIFPNPFYEEATISFTVGNPGNVKIEIFNLFGQKVNKLTEGFYETGQYEIKWNGTNAIGLKVKPGLYFIRMTARGYNKTLKIQLLN